MMNPRAIAVEILTRIEHTGAYADVLLENELARRPELAPPDRALTAELVNGTLRWQRKLDWMATELYRGRYPKIPLKIRKVVQISLYQLLFLEKIPAYAAVDEGVELAKAIGGPYWGRVVNGLLRSFSRRRSTLTLPRVEQNPVEALAIGYSHPEWLIERWLARFGLEETEQLCKANNQTPHLCLRVNRLKTTPEALLATLATHGIDAGASAFAPEFIRASSLPDLRNFAPFSEGHFTVQDESAGLVGYLLDPKPGEKVVDLCSAPGGKTTHIAELMNDRGQVIAVDKHFRRLKLIGHAAQRLGLRCIVTVAADGTKFATRPVDKVLVDAPCTGTGVLAKRADLRWRRRPEDLRVLPALQFDLLQSAAALVRKGGVIVYSTCSIELEENDKVVESFLSANCSFVLEPADEWIPSTLVDEKGFVRTFPHRHGMDGSFAVRLRRIEDSPSVR